MKKLVFCVLSVCLLFASQANQASGQSAVRPKCQVVDLTKAVEDRNVIDLNSADIPNPLAEYIDDVKIIPLEVTDESLIRFIYRVLSIDDKIIIYDTTPEGTPIKVFDKSGKYLYSIHRGKGPHEVEGAPAVAIDYTNKQLLFAHPRGIMYTTLDGKFIKEEKINFDFREFAVMDDKLVFRTDYSKNEKLGKYSGKSFFVTDRKYKPIYSAVPLYEKTRWLTEASIVKTSEGVAFTKVFNDTIYCYNGKIVYPMYNLMYSKSLLKGKSPDTVSDLEYQFNISDRFCYMGLFQEASNTQFFRLTNMNSDKGVLLICAFRDKTSGKVIWTKENRPVGPKYDKVKNVNSFVFGGSPYGVCGDYFVTTLEYHLKQQHLKSLKPFLKPEDMKKVQNMTEEDNPMLILYKFKKF